MQSFEQEVSQAGSKKEQHVRLGAENGRDIKIRVANDHHRLLSLIRESVHYGDMKEILLATSYVGCWLIVIVIRVLRFPLGMFGDVQGGQIIAGIFRDNRERAAV